MQASCEAPAARAGPATGAWSAGAHLPRRLGRSVLAGPWLLCVVLGKRAWQVHPDPGIHLHQTYGHRSTALVAA